MMGERSVCFGFGLSPYARFTDVADLVDTVVLAEQLGYGVVGLPEHLLPPASSDTPEWMKVWYDQPVLAAFLAARTSRIVFMPGVHVAPYHPPVQAAKALATLDVVSGGRLRLAAGVGWYEAEFDRLGLPFHRRGAMTDEYLRAMKVLWTAQQPCFSGTFVSFREVSFLPKPSGIPLYLGGMAEPTLRRVAEYGDGWYPMTDDPEVIRAGVARIAELRTLAGRPAAAVGVVCSLMVAEDPHLAVLRRHVRFDSDEQWPADRPPSGDGRPSSGAGTERPDRGRSERLPPSVCIARADELVDAGATTLMAKFAWADAAELRAELRWFAAHVMPAFR